MLKLLARQKSTLSNQPVCTFQPCSPSFFGSEARQYRAWMTLVGTLIGLAVSHSAAQAASFSGLGFLPGDTSSSATGVSADGSVVVGSSGNQAFRWTQSSGLAGLGFLPGGGSSSAAGVSADGSVVVGESFAPAIPIPPYYYSVLQAFRWTQAEGMRSLTVGSSASGVSADGSVVVGTLYAPKFFSEALVWTSGIIQGLRTYPYLESSAHGVSADGSVVVGSARSFTSSITEAFRWTQAAGLQVLGLLPGNSFSSASAVSADGSVIVGQSGDEAFVWNSIQGMQGLGFLPGNSFSSASAVSADGSVIVGQSGGEAFVWSSTQGMQSLTDVLIAAGVGNLTGWGLANAMAISADGYTVVGHGTNPGGQQEAWIADLRNTQPVPTPALLPGLIGMGLATWRRQRQSSADS
jgi:uncharacterized membrane protein